MFLNPKQFVIQGYKTKLNVGKNSYLFCCWLTSPMISGTVRNSTEPPDERLGFDISNRSMPGFLLDRFEGLVESVDSQPGFIVLFDYKTFFIKKNLR